MNGEATAPQPVVAATGEDRVLAACGRLEAALADNRAVLLRLMAGHGDLTELVLAENRLADLAHDLRQATAAVRRASVVSAVEDLLAQAPAPLRLAPPPPRSHRRRSRERVPGQGTLWPVPGIAAAVGFLHRLAHPGLAGKALAVHVAKVTAIGVAGATAATGVVAVTAAVIAPPSSQPGSWGAGAAPAASAYAAAPAPDPSLIARMTRPKAGTDAHGAARDLSAPGFVPPYASPSSVPSSQPAQAATSPAASAAGGPAVLASIPATLDLSVFSSATVVLTAGGSGWASWRVDTTGTDLDFSKTGGVLAAGQSYELIVSLDPSQDGATSQTFDVAGQQVTVTLPAPPAPAPAVTATDAPSSFPTDLAPSPSSS